MAQTPTIYRWALVDKTGKTRMTCEAYSNPVPTFEGMRGGNRIPDGWNVVKRGPVTPADRHKAQAKSEPAAQPEPQGEVRKFKVGDLVRRTNRVPGMTEPGTIGTIESLTPFRVQWGVVNQSRIMIAEQIELVEPAKPQMLGDAGSELEESRAALVKAEQRITELEKERDYAHREFSSLHQRARRAEQLVEAETQANKNAIARLRDMESMRDQLREILDVPLGTSLVTAAQDIKANLDETRGLLDNACLERNAAEAKLADIRAINRVAEMVSQIPDDAEPWHFQGLVQSVLDR